MLEPTTASSISSRTLTSPTSTLSSLEMASKTLNIYSLGLQKYVSHLSPTLLMVLNDLLIKGTRQLC